MRWVAGGWGGQDAVKVAGLSGSKDHPSLCGSERSGDLGAGTRVCVCVCVCVHRLQRPGVIDLSLPKYPRICRPV